MNRLALARYLFAQGFCVIPLLPNGKKPARKWKRFQTERPTDAELVEWFGENDFEPANVTGAISGITVIDCDSAEAAAACEARGIRPGLRQRSKRGVHLVFRHSGERNTTGLDGMRGVNRRGEGGFVRAYPDSADWMRSAVDRQALLPGPPQTPRSAWCSARSPSRPNTRKPLCGTMLAAHDGLIGKTSTGKSRSGSIESRTKRWRANHSWQEAR